MLHAHSITEADSGASSQSASLKLRRLAAVQALRGAAATAVVMSHAARHVNKVFGAPVLIDIFQAGHAGVDLFFVISGFIILFVHRSDIGRANRFAHYAGRRFNRVVPLYWIALSLTIGLSLAGGHGLPPIGRIVWSATLLPSSGEPLLGIAWTLQYEAVFYAAFAFLIFNRYVGSVVFVAWFVLVLATVLGYGVSAPPPELCGPYCFEFFMGMAAAFLVQKNAVKAASVVAVVGVALFCGALVAESLGLIDGFGSGARLVYGGAAFLLVTGLANAEQRGQITVPAWLVAAGEASYSIYLFQFVFIGLVWQAWTTLGLGRSDTDIPCFLALALSAIAGGVLVSRLIEHPLLRLTRRSHPSKAGP